MMTSLPPKENAHNFAKSILKALPHRDRKVRLRVCEIVEHCTRACAQSEDTDALAAAAYLQEVGVVYSSKEKELYSFEIVRHAYVDFARDFPETIADCIQNHTRDQRAQTPEGQLMQICYKYVKTHYQDYLLLKSGMSRDAFQRLQAKRIAEYRRHLADHPRGSAINSILESVFLLEEPTEGAAPKTQWHRELATLNNAFPFSIIHGHRTSA